MDDDLIKKSENWKGNFSDFEKEIKDTIMSSVYHEDVKKAYIRFATGKQLNDMCSTDYCIYDKWVYSGIIFDENSNYKCRELVRDYDCICTHKILYVEKTN